MNLKFWNLHYGDTMPPGSYDSIRDNCVKRLVEKGIAVSQAKESSLTKNSSTAGYGLSDSFVELVSTYGTESQDEALAKFNSYQSNLDSTGIGMSKKSEVFQKVTFLKKKDVLFDEERIPFYIKIDIFLF